MQPPLAEQLRPQTLDDFVGQTHLVDKEKPLYQMIKSKTIHSMIFWGPPGCGKTTLAKIIAASLDADIHQLSAVAAGKKDVKKIVEMGQKKAQIEHEQLSLTREEPSEENNNKQTILFLDEIHRFNKAQQDYLLPYVENGTITLIGATTENPSFEVISALLSRCRVYMLKQLTPDEIEQVIDRAIPIIELKIQKKAKVFLSEWVSGDARKAIGVLQISKDLLQKKAKSNHIITLQLIKDILQNKTLLYDKHADQHYDTISAFIKSMRASNMDAALYYLARMVEAGEDSKFIARRMVVFASEDIGLAVPTALVVANAVFRAIETIGYPEAQINLAHGVAYLCQCTKDRSAYDAYFRALDDVKAYGDLPIPLKIRNAPTKLMKELDYGKGYEMYDGGTLLPEKLKGKKYYK